MKKDEIDGIIELIPTIQEAIEYCRNGNLETKLILFEDCEVAISSVLEILKDQIGDSEYSELEDAVEVFKNVNPSLVEEGFYDNVNKTLSKLINDFKDTNIVYEIVFLPYNVTMWDSLESIWEAAKQDPRCTCRVIPIPYYDKNKDGSLGQMHYDGDKFPEYVEITHYSKYDIEKARPNIIYIHNPYDNYNRVTTVDPKYYSSNLKKFTEMLVYVPYFVVMDHLQMEYCILPGVRNSSKVIVQSEEIAEEYINYYSYGDKDKFLPLGSPKLDKAVKMSRLTREDLDLPEEWKKKVEGKKVILYNTHLDNIMNRGELLIKKLKYVFSCFEGRDDVVLLWRPHPLSEVTAASINPDVLGEYKKIEEEFINKGFGIYDNTPDLHRSIALADAYFGDGSSLVVMFRVTGKPVMLQDVNVISEPLWEDINRIPFEDAYINENDMWFASSSFNGLFYMNRETGKTEYIGEFIGEELSEIRLYSKVVKVDNKLFFIPFNATSIAEYDMENNQFKRIEIEDNEIKKKFLSYAVFENYIYLMPLFYGRIIRFNFKIEKINYMEYWNKKIEKFKIIKGIWFRDVFQINEKLYCPFYQKNLIMIFDLKNENMEVVELGKETDLFQGIEYDGEKFWLIPEKRGYIACWKKGEKRISYIKDFPKSFEFQNQDVPFLSTSFSNGKVWILPCYANSILQIDVQTNKIHNISFEIKKPINRLNPDTFWEFGGIHSDNNEVILYQFNTLGMIVFDKKGKIKSIQKVTLPETMRKEDMIKYSLKNIYGEFIEEDYYSLNTYISRVESLCFEQKNIINNYQICGENINNYFLNT